MKFKELQDLLKKDRERWHNEKKWFSKLISSEYKLVYLLRWCSFLSSNRLLFPIFIVIWCRYKSLAKKSGCDINIHTKIGGGFRIYHINGIVINDKASIGENCTIRTGCVIGENHNGVPIIGDNVNFGVHCLIIGNIKINNGAVIGAGAIVTHDVPENGVVYGQSAIVRNYKNCSVDAIVY